MSYIQYLLDCELYLLAAFFSSSLLCPDRHDAGPAKVGRLNVCQNDENTTRLAHFSDPGVALYFILGCL